MAKLGASEKPLPEKSTVTFVLMDNQHQTEHGVRFMCARSQKFVLITSNEQHPAFRIEVNNLHILFQKSLPEALTCLKEIFSCERLTIQSGGTLNGLFLREKLIDYVDIIVAPVLVGGKDTPTLIDGNYLVSPNKLSKLGVLKRIDCQILKHSDLRLCYKVVR